MARSVTMAAAAAAALAAGNPMMLLLAGVLIGLVIRDDDLTGRRRFA